MFLFHCFVVVFLLSFFHLRIVRPKIRERILLQLFMYMREKNEIKLFPHATNTFDMMHHVTLCHMLTDYVIYWQ